MICPVSENVNVSGRRPSNKDSNQNGRKDKIVDWCFSPYHIYLNLLQIFVWKFLNNMKSSIMYILLRLPFINFNFDKKKIPLISHIIYVHI